MFDSLFLPLKLHGTRGPFARLRHSKRSMPYWPGWLAVLRDPSVSKALALIHARPSFSWTIEGLARQCGASRSVFAERFMQLIGVPPMHYLARWRMQVASEMLKRRNLNMAAIASEIGYESEAAFSRSFKRMMGVTPSAWRQGVRREPASDPAENEGMQHANHP